MCEKPRLKITEDSSDFQILLAGHFQPGFEYLEITNDSSQLNPPQPTVNYPSEASLQEWGEARLNPSGQPSGTSLLPPRTAFEVKTIDEFLSVRENCISNKIPLLHQNNSPKGEPIEPAGEPPDNCFIPSKLQILKNRLLELIKISSSQPTSELAPEPETDLNQSPSPRTQRNTVNQQESFTRFDESAANSTQNLPAEENNASITPAIKRWTEIRSQKFIARINGPEITGSPEKTQVTPGENLAFRIFDFKPPELVSKGDDPATTTNSELLDSPDEHALSQNMDSDSQPDLNQGEYPSPAKKEGGNSVIFNHNRILENTILNSTKPVNLNQSTSTRLDKLQQIINQIGGRIKIMLHTRQNEMSISLQPESLGQMKLGLIIKENVMSLKIVVDNLKTKQLLEENFPQLHQQLAGQNLKIEKFEIDIRPDVSRFAENLTDHDSNQQNGRPHREKHAGFSFNQSAPRKPIVLDSPRIRRPATTMIELWG